MRRRKKVVLGFHCILDCLQCIILQTSNEGREMAAAWVTLNIKHIYEWGCLKVLK